MKAVSKINLFLEVVGKRADGYHEIRTVFHPLGAPSDDVVVGLRDGRGIAIESESPDIPLGEANICWRAAAKFAEEAGVEPCWTIRLKKGIPVAAGLGGGSSDAAAVLSILGAMHPGRCEIRGIAERLGADVAFFLDPVPSVGEGVGEKLRPLGVFPQIPILVVNPLFPVSSAWAYSHFKGPQSSRRVEDMAAAMVDGDIAKIAACLRNDLAPALYHKFPILEMLRNSIVDAGALGAEISGSGSSLFGIFPDANDLGAAGAMISDQYGDAVRTWTASGVTNRGRSS